MNDKLKIAIAIPTYNRLEKLKVALQGIEQQEVDDGLELYCVVSNIASTDGTTEYLDTLAGGRVRYVINNRPEENIYLNWMRCADTVPAAVDWVWFHGDDDVLTSSTAVLQLAELIRSHGCPELGLVHVADARRSRRSGRVIEGPLLALCNDIGYIEVLGWMSSLVMRTDRFKRALGSTNSLTEEHLRSVGDVTDPGVRFRQSAFKQCKFFLEAMISDRAIFWDQALVQVQDEVRTEDAMRRSADEREVERYVYVVDDVLDLLERGVIAGPVRPSFFRFQRISLWDRFANIVVYHVLQNNSISDEFIGHIERIKKLELCFQNLRHRKLFLQWHQLLLTRVALHINLLRSVEESRQALANQASFNDVASYTYEILDEDGEVHG